MNKVKKTKIKTKFINHILYNNQSKIKQKEMLGGESI